MTRDDYRLFKEQLKRYAANLRQHKADVKEWQRTKTGTPAYGQAKDYLDCRAGHIFMSMVRGHTREQIEPNFANQIDPTHRDFKGIGLVRALEDRIGKLCDQYGFEADNDEKFRIIRVTLVEPDLKSEEAGA